MDIYIIIKLIDFTDIFGKGGGGRIMSMTRSFKSRVKKVGRYQVSIVRSEIEWNVSG